MITYRTVSINDLGIFYREAGSRSNPIMSAIAWLSGCITYVP